MNKYPDQTRNLNPTAEARVAMIVWGYEYSQQPGGSMEFWDTLDDRRKRICRMVVAELSKTPNPKEASNE